MFLLVNRMTLRTNGLSLDEFKKHIAKYAEQPKTEDFWHGYSAACEEGSTKLISAEGLAEMINGNPMRAGDWYCINVCIKPIEEDDDDE